MRLDPLTLLEDAPWITVLLDASGQIQIANEAAREWMGLGPLARPQFLPYIQSPVLAADTNALGQLLLEGRTHSIPVQLRARIGPVRRFHLVSSPMTLEGQDYTLVQCFPEPVAPEPQPQPAPIPVVLSSPAVVIPLTTVTSKSSPTDLSAAAELEAAALESSLVLKQKLDCALQLTRTVALDFNNALTSILGHTSHLLAKIEPAHPWRSALLEVEKSAEKAAEIAYDLAAFSREERDSHAHSSGNINDVVRQTVELFQKNDNAGLNWILQLENRIYAATYDEAKIQQALVKVLDNAVQAVGQSGTVLVSSKNVDVDADDASRPSGLAPGHYVRIEVIDDGPGIASSILGRVFEPFFTTKPNPPHRGLGLAWVYGIVTNHGGRVSVDSVHGQGCHVTIHLPAHKRVFHDHSGKGEGLEGSGTILMVDDEDLILTMGETILSAYGYEVLRATSGEEALKLYDGASGKVDLVITDMVMPTMGGRELIEQLKKRDPSLKIICSTGYVRNVHTASEEGYLLKPFTSQDLLRKVKNMLGGA